MKKILILLLFAGCISASTLTDSSSVRISAQDSIPAYSPTDIVVMQKKIGGTYKWKKMYMSQLRTILQDTLKFNGVDTSKDYTWTGSHLWDAPSYFNSSVFINSGALELGRSGYNSGSMYFNNDSLSSNATILYALRPTAIRSLALPNVSDTLANRAWVRGVTTALPSQTGNSGKYLKTNGSTASWATVAGGVDTSKSYTWTGPGNSYTHVVTFQSGIDLHDRIGLPTSTITPTNGGLSYTTTGGYGTLPLYFVGSDGAWDTLTTRAWVRSSSGSNSFPLGLSVGLAHSANAGINFYNISNSYKILLYPLLPTANVTLYLPSSGDTLADRAWVKSHVPTLAGNITWTGNHVFGGSGKVVQFLNPPYFGALGSLNGQFYLESAGSYYTLINATTPTANRTVTFPDASGTVALTSQVPTLAGSNTWTGANTFNVQPTSIDGLNLGKAYVENGYLAFNRTNNFYYMTFSTNELTTYRQINLPDASGTLALTILSPTLVGAIGSNTIDATGARYIEYYGAGSGNPLITMTGGVNGQVVVITNHSAGTLQITENVVANGFGNGGSGIMNIVPYMALSFIYNSSVGMWLHIK